MVIYELTRKDETLAIFSRSFILTHYYLMTTKVSIREIALIETVVEDLCIKQMDFEEYSKYWINDYKLKIRRKDD